jgi:hypothetical protein
MGIIGSHVDLTTGWRGHQAKPPAPVAFAMLPSQAPVKDGHIFGSPVPKGDPAPGIGEAAPAARPTVDFRIGNNPPGTRAFDVCS